MRLLLTIQVYIDAYQAVNGHHAEAAMLLFHGNAEGEYFQGTIAPGGVDTQYQRHGESRSLSARYMLSGTDFTGQECRIFVQNEGEFAANGEIVTTPKLLTDSKALAEWEELPLHGTLEDMEGGVRIRIFAKER